MEVYSITSKLLQFQGVNAAKDNKVCKPQSKSSHSEHGSGPNLFSMSLSLCSRVLVERLLITYQEIARLLCKPQFFSAFARPHHC